MLYHYVDIHITVLERMYNKRLNGYAHVTRPSKSYKEPKPIQECIELLKSDKKEMTCFAFSHLYKISLFLVSIRDNLSLPEIFLILTS